MLEALVLRGRGLRHAETQCIWGVSNAAKSQIVTGAYYRSQSGRSLSWHALQVRWLSSSPPGSKKKKSSSPAPDRLAMSNLALHDIVNLPNMITTARIIATPYLGYLIIQGEFDTAMGVLAVAGFSDWLDGYLARTLKKESIIGSFLDPLADKLMVGTLSLSMMWKSLLPWPLVVLIFGRDALLVSGTFYYRWKTKEVASAFFDTHDSSAFQVKPSLISKMNTALQFATFGFALMHGAWQIPPQQALDYLFVLVGTTTFLSGSEYLYAYRNKTGVFRHFSATVSKAKKRTSS